jgi:hypothetical protein
MEKPLIQPLAFGILRTGNVFLQGEGQGRREAKKKPV